MTCIIAANRIGTRRAAALAAAYSISEKAYTEYREKVAEKFGEKKEEEIRAEIAQEHIDRTPVPDMIVIGDAEVLCFDQRSGRYFNSTMETIRKAVNDVNFEILHNMYCTLDDFYDKVGLESTRDSQEVGWNNGNLMDVKFSSVLKEGKPVMVIDFNYGPVREYYTLHG